MKYFSDERYIKYNNQPLFAIYKPHLIPNCFEYIEILKNIIFINTGIKVHVAAFDTGSTELVKVESIFD